MKWSRNIADAGSPMSPTQFLHSVARFCLVTLHKSLLSDPGSIAQPLETPMLCIAVWMPPWHYSQSGPILIRSHPETCPGCWWVMQVLKACHQEPGVDIPTQCYPTPPPPPHLRTTDFLEFTLSHSALTIPQTSPNLSQICRNGIQSAAHQQIQFSSAYW